MSGRQRGVTGVFRAMRTGLAATREREPDNDHARDALDRPYVRALIDRLDRLGIRGESHPGPTCRVCGVPIVVGNERRVYCGEKCRQAARDGRRRRA